MKLAFEIAKPSELKNIFDGDLYTLLKNNLIALMMGQKDNLFRAQTSPDGEAWLPLGALSKAKRNRKIKDVKKKGQISILNDTGTLKNSITKLGAPYGISTIEGDEVGLGTNVEYAAAQNFGATIDVAERSSLFTSDLKTKTNKILPASKFTIPARPFMGIGSKDEEEISNFIDLFASENGGFE